MNICVFCSCSEVGEPYESAVRELGQVLGRDGNTLVFGGFSEGLMGAIADGFSSVGAPVVGIAPQDLLETGRCVHPNCCEAITAQDLTQRKINMIERSDAFVAAPGGIGTLDELFSVLGMVITNEVEAPVVIDDFNGFYAGLETLLRGMESTKFIRSALDGIVTFAKTPEEVLTACAGKSTYIE